MKIKLLFLYCIFCVSSVYGQANWQLLNPKPTSNIGNDIDFVSNDTGFIITNTELLETTDAGVSWHIKQLISSGNDMSFKQGHGYIVGNFGYVMKSTDNGASWVQIYTGFDTNSFTSVTIIDMDHIILSSATHLVKTNDGGMTWEILNIPNVSVNRTVFITSMIGHAACDNGTILKTIDGGENWYATQTANFYPSDYITLYFVNENVGFATREHSTTYKTTNGGETWVELTGINNAVYDFHFLDENIGFSTGDGGATFKTTDGGITWSNIFFQNGYYYNTSMYGIYFQDSLTGYATGARGRIIKTTDGGDTWTEHSPTYNDIRKIEFITDTEIGYACVGGTFFKTTDFGTTWVDNGTPNDYPGLTVTDFDFVNVNVGYALIYGLVYKTINGGASWYETNNGNSLLNESLYTISFIDENIGYVSGGFNQKKVLKTVNGGISWTTVASLSFPHMQFLNADVGYGVMGKKMYKTGDGGITWNISIEVDEYINSIHFTDENTGYFVGDNALMYKTIDGGTSWRELNIPYEYYVEVKFFSNNVGYIANEDGMLYKTIDGGESWIYQNTQYGISSIDYNSDTIFTAGSNGKIYKSDITFVPFALQVNQPIGISNINAFLNGSVASNTGEITNIQFEYSNNYFFNNAVAVPTYPTTVTADQSFYFTTAATDLSPNTTYYVRLTGYHNSNFISSNPISFTTLPDYEITTEYTYNYTAISSNVSGTIISAQHDITDVVFEYGTTADALSSSISGTPTTVAGTTTEYITATLDNLEPETQYFYRIKANHQGEFIYGDVLSFTTRAPYSISLQQPYIYENNVELSAYVTSNSQEINDLVFEYGSIDYENEVILSPSQIVAFGSNFVSTTLSNLEANTIYYYRLKGVQNGEILYSNEGIFTISEEIVMVTGTIDEPESNSLELKGLIFSNGFFLTNIHFEYGTTENFGSTILGNPNYAYGYSTHLIKATIDNILPNQTYFYRLGAFYSGNFIYSDTYQFTAGGLGMNDIFSDDQLLVYPNPATDVVNIKAESLGKIRMIRIYDALGKLIHIENDVNSSSLITIDVSHLGKGLYLLNAISTDNKMITKKLILK